MLLNMDAKREVLLAPQAGAFASAAAITSKPLVNYKTVRFLICTGTGEAADVNVTVEAQDGVAGTPVPMPFLCAERNAQPVEKPETGVAVTIGGDDTNAHLYAITVTADMLARFAADRVTLKVTAAAGSTVPGAIIAEYNRPRYTENNAE